MPPRAGAAAGGPGAFRDEQQQGQLDGKESVRQGQGQGKAQVQAAPRAAQDQRKKPKKSRRPSPPRTRRPRKAPPEKEKPKPAPRPPADPRLKFLKKFHGKFLPRGPLRDRLKALMLRWDSGEDHGGVTVEELKSLYTGLEGRPGQKPARGDFRMRDGQQVGPRLFAAGAIVSGVPVLPREPLDGGGDHRGGVAGTIVRGRRDGLLASS